MMNHSQDLQIKSIFLELLGQTQISLHFYINITILEINYRQLLVNTAKVEYRTKTDPIATRFCNLKNKIEAEINKLDRKKYKRSLINLLGKA